MTINLNSITNPGIIGTLSYECAFDTETGIYFPPGIIDIYIHKNNLSGGYLGNTLLEESKISNKGMSHVDMRIGNLLFSQAFLEIDYQGKRFKLKNKYNYLRLKADFLKDGQITKLK